jgi:hypothetical protein
MSIRFCLPLLALGLAACGDSAEEPKSQEDVVAAMEELAKPEPGQYKTTTEILELSVPGLSADQTEQMKQMGQLGGGDSERCLTEEEASRGFEDMVRDMGNADENMKCDFVKFDVDGSDLDAKMKCDGPSGTGAEMVMSGTVESGETDLAMDMKVDAGPMGEMNMKMKMNSKRVGPCT